MSVRDGLDREGGSLSVRASGFHSRHAYVEVVGPHARGTGALPRGNCVGAASDLFEQVSAMAEDGPDRLIVSAEIGGDVVEVSLRLDSEGRIAETHAPDRPRAVKDKFIATSWRGFFSDYRSHEGWLIPFSGGASWTVDGAEFTYAELTIVHWEM